MDTGAIKEKGQVFTPAGIVTMILDSVNYNGRSVLEKSIMEPSFGNGAFLIEIISRLTLRTTKVVGFLLQPPLHMLPEGRMRLTRCPQA